MIIINNIKASLDADLSDVCGILSSKMKINKQDIIGAELYRKSVDARDNRDLHFYCVLKLEIHFLTRQQSI